MESYPVRVWLAVRLMYSSHCTQSVKIRNAEGFPSINTCSMSSEARV